MENEIKGAEEVTERDELTPEEGSGDVAAMENQRDAAVAKLGGMAKIMQQFGKKTVTFTKPFEWCGVKYEKMEMNFEALTGEDLEAIDDELAAMGRLVPEPRSSRIYQRILAARAANVPSDMVQKLPAADYSAVMRAARNFLTVTG